MQLNPVQARENTVVRFGNGHPLGSRYIPFVERSKTDRRVVFAELGIGGRDQRFAGLRKSEIRSRPQISDQVGVVANDAAALTNSKNFRGVEAHHRWDTPWDKGIECRGCIDDDS